MENGGRWYETHWKSQHFLADWALRTLEEVDFIESTLALTRGARVLDLACGQGRHSIELARRGYRPLGIDISEELIAEARRRAGGLHADFTVADAATFATHEQFDAVLNLYDGAIGYAATEEENDSLFRAIADALLPGGHSVVHVLNAAHYEERDSFKTWTVGAHALVLSSYQWCSVSRRLRHGGHIFPLGSRLPATIAPRPPADYRLYKVDELTDRLAANGLRVQWLLNRYDIAPPFDDGGKELVIVSIKETA